MRLPEDRAKRALAHQDGEVTDLDRTLGARGHRGESCRQIQDGQEGSVRAALAGPRNPQNKILAMGH